MSNMSNRNSVLSVYLNKCMYFLSNMLDTIMYIFRLIKEITHREYERIKGRDVEVPVLTKKKLKKGKTTPYPLCW